MPTIGLDNLYYAKITEATSTTSSAVEGDESYGTPIKLAKAISVDLSIELAEAILYADDGPAYAAKEFKGGKITLNIDDIGTQKAADLTGSAIDENGALISESEDVGSPVAVGFRSKLPDGKYRYFWLYRVLFGTPNIELETKGENIVFKTPTIEGTIMRRNKVDDKGKHPWKAELREGDTGASSTAISGWFSAVYEPDFTPATP